MESTANGEHILDDGSLLKWVLGGIVALLSGAVSVIATLFKLHESQNAKRISALEVELHECEKKHEHSSAEILQLSIKVAALESRENLSSK